MKGGCLKVRLIFSQKRRESSQSSMWLLPWSGSSSLLVFKSHWQQIGSVRSSQSFLLLDKVQNDKDQMFAYSNVLLKHKLSSSQVFFIAENSPP